MSTLIVDEIEGPSSLNNIVTFPRGVTFYTPGMVIQSAWKEYHRHQTVSANNDSVSRDISGLNIDFAPKKSNSLIQIQWWLFWEARYNMTFQAKRDGSVVGFNTNLGASDKQSGIASGRYERENNQSSTPAMQHMTFIDEPGGTSTYTYSLGVRSSNTSNYTLRINRALNSFSDSYEAGVSWVLVEEIAQ